MFARAVSVDAIVQRVLLMVHEVSIPINSSCHTYTAASTQFLRWWHVRDHNRRVSAAPSNFDQKRRGVWKATSRPPGARSATVHACARARTRRAHAQNSGPPDHSSTLPVDTAHHSVMAADHKNVGIYGFGRIGRLVFRIAWDIPELEVGYHWQWLVIARWSGRVCRRICRP